MATKAKRGCFSSRSKTLLECSKWHAALRADAGQMFLVAKTDSLRENYRSKYQLHARFASACAEAGHSNVTNQTSSGAR